MSAVVCATRRRQAKTQEWIAIQWLITYATLLRSEAWMPYRCWHDAAWCLVAVLKMHNVPYISLRFDRIRTCSIYDQSVVHPQASSTVYIYLECVIGRWWSMQIRKQQGSPVCVCPLQVKCGLRCQLCIKDMTTVLSWFALCWTWNLSRSLPDCKKQWGKRLTLSLHQSGMLVELR